MRADASQLFLSSLVVDRTSTTGLAEQVYELVRKAILNGHLRPGTRIPSTRALAAHLSVARNTVTSAYDQLVSEGYLSGRTGSGTTVAESLPETLLAVPAVDSARAKQVRLSKRGTVLAATPDMTPAYQRPRPFVAGVPDLSEFPFDVWLRLITKHWRSPLMSMVCCSDPAGYPPLREAIAFYLRAARSVYCEPEQVLIVSGSRQGVDLAVRLIVDRGDYVLMEDPGYPGALHTFKAAGAEIIPLDVDEAGAVVPPEDCPAKLAFLTPSHQYPLGVTMPLDRRQAWLDWAERHDAWIVEDDFDSEYRYSGTPQPAMQGLARGQRVIYAGTFSKTLFPSLRIGFLVLPPELVGPFRRARAVIDGFPAILEQAVLANFIEQGHFGRHVRRMRTIYEERRSVMVESVTRYLGGRLEIGASDSGMHVVGWLPEGYSEEGACAAAASVGVHMRPLSTCCVRPFGRPGVILGFATTTANDIRDAVRKLAAVLHSDVSAAGKDWDRAEAERTWAIGGD